MGATKQQLRKAFLAGCRLGQGYNQETLDSYFETVHPTFLEVGEDKTTETTTSNKHTEEKLLWL